MPNDSNILNTHRVGVGDTLTPLGLTLFQGGEPVNLAGKTVKVVGRKNDATEWFAERTTGVTSQDSLGITVTADASTDRFTATDHRLKSGDIVRFSTTGTLPAGVEAGTNYVVYRPTQHTFQVCDPGTPTTEIDLTTAGTPTITCIPLGRVTIDLQTADVATAGTFWLWVRVYSGSEFDTFPMDGRKLQVEVGAVA